MSIPLDIALYEDLSPSAAQNIAAALGQSLGVFGANALQNYQLAKNLERLNLPTSLAGLPKNLQDSALKNYLQRQQLENILQLIPDNQNYQQIEQPDSLTPSQPTMGEIPSIAPTLKSTLEVPERKPSPINRVEQMERSNQIATQLSAVNPQIAQVYKAGEEAKQKVYAARSDREYERLKPVLKTLDQELLQAIPKQLALDNLRNAITQGNIGGISRDYLADLTGAEFLRSAKGAQFITSSKEFFLGSISRAGARPNQWIEQQIRTFLPLLGRSEEANLLATEMLQANLNVQKTYPEIVNQIMENDYNTYGDLQFNVLGRSQKALNKYANEQQTLLERKMIDIIYPNNVPMKDSQDNYYSIPHDRVDEALSKGLNVYGD